MVTSSPNPVANPGAIVAGPNHQFTILNSRLIRYEWAADGKFEDRASIPEFRVVDGNDLEIIAAHFHLSYNKTRLSPEGLFVHLNSKSNESQNAWRFGLSGRGNLGGTAHTG
jgi:hypothetical protein